MVAVQDNNHLLSGYRISNDKKKTRKGQKIKEHQKCLCTKRDNSIARRLDMSVHLGPTYKPHSLESGYSGKPNAQILSHIWTAKHLNPRG